MALNGGLLTRNYQRVADSAEQDQTAEEFERKLSVRYGINSTPKNARFHHDKEVTGKYCGKRRKY